uniref:Uncharacterized protein n=1 Tax=Anguilla anguilla TaxID=7936 RepID=A0A0E9S2L2_ANGAN
MQNSSPGLILLQSCLIAMTNENGCTRFPPDADVFHKSLSQTGRD